MPYVNKKQYDELCKTLSVYCILKGELARHEEFVEKYNGSFASMNKDSNFEEIKQKRDLLKEILRLAEPQVTRDT